MEYLKYLFIFIPLSFIINNILYLFIIYDYFILDFLQVLLDDSNFMADSLASIIKLYVAGDITEGTASIVIVLEKVMWDIYAKD